MSKSLLITRPFYDPATNYLFHWSKPIIEEAKKKNMQVYNLERKRANRKEVTSILSKRQPSLVVFNGHGDSDRISGQAGEILVKTGENEELLKFKIIYAVSCKSAAELGPSSIQAGALSYTGYNDDFIFFYEVDRITRPLEDKTVRLFLEPSNRVAISLIKGHTAKSAHERSKAAFRQNIEKLLISESVDSYLVRYLYWDMIHQVCLGDGDASF